VQSIDKIYCIQRYLFVIGRDCKWSDGKAFTHDIKTKINNSLFLRQTFTDDGNKLKCGAKQV